MKSLRLLLITLFLITAKCEIQSQSVQTDSVNIRALVQNQIEQIKNKDVASSEENSNSQSAGFSDDILLKIFAIIDISLVVVMYILWRRRKIKIENVKTGRLKRNIIKLRQEKVGSKENQQLSKIRKQLKLDPAFRYADDKYITSYAKKMSVSKGELYLAAKLNSFLREGNGRTSY